MPVIQPTKGQQAKQKHIKTKHKTKEKQRQP
jgi:hypothetical protein